MRISAKDTICGLRPATLKELLAKDDFTTLYAFKKLGLDVRETSQTLIDLCEAGWIRFAGTWDYIDHWTVTEKGHRLLATRLGARFPREEGRRIVQEVVKLAGAINREPERSRRIKEIRLFGSVLTGSDDETAGDVDLVVLVERRLLPKEILGQLEQAERQSAPSHFDPVDQIHWPRTQILRQLKSISRKISLHGNDDLTTLNAPYQTVYAFDFEKESEVPFDPAIKQAAKGSDFAEAAMHQSGLASRAADRVEVPEMPDRLPKERHIQQQNLHKAWHMWQRGAPLEAIAEMADMSKASVCSYLASFNRQEPVPYVFDASFRATLSQALQGQRNYWIGVNLMIFGANQALIEVHAKLPDNRTIVGEARLYVGLKIGCSGYSHTFPIIGLIADYALRWYKQMGSRFGDLRAKVSTVFAPTDGPEPLVAPRPLEFADLERPMDEFLRERFPVAVDKRSRLALQVTLAERIRVQETDAFGKPRRKFTHVPIKQARGLEAAVRAISAKRSPSACRDESLTLWHTIEPACQAV